jgi:hypothetical protein
MLDGGEALGGLSVQVNTAANRYPAVLIGG